MKDTCESDRALAPFSKLESKLENDITVDDLTLDQTFITTARWANRIWLFSLSIWGVGLVVRAISAIADGYCSPVELSQLLAATVIFWSCLYFKPVEGISSIGSEYSLSQLREAKSVVPNASGGNFGKAEARMTELQKYHLISQEYTFPFPYLCQIYHLLNLKHLENVHSFSLSNLKVLKISELQLTEIGGAMKFQTILDSPINTLRIWRQPIVEVDLVLHTSHTIELSIPAYNDKRIIVIFNVIPMGEREHKLFIDIYSNLQWPRPILQIFLHLAACLTVLEDFPYLRKLAARNLDRVVRSHNISNHDTMWLFRRFAELYGTRVEPLIG